MYCRWIEQQVGASAKCTDGTYDSSITPEVLLQACEDGTIGESYVCYGETCGTYPVNTDNDFDVRNELQHVLLHMHVHQQLCIRARCNPPNS